MWRRFMLGFLLASFLAAPTPAVVLWENAGCAPRTCQHWDMSDWQWWYFGCDRPMCPDFTLTRPEQPQAPTCP